MQTGRQVGHSMAFSVDGERLACGGGDGSVNLQTQNTSMFSMHVFDATTGALLRRLGEEEYDVEWVQFAPANNSILATVSKTSL